MEVAATDTSTSVSAFAFADLNRVLCHRESRWIPVSLLAGGKRFAARRSKVVCLCGDICDIKVEWELGERSTQFTI